MILVVKQSDGSLNVLGPDAIQLEPGPGDSEIQKNMECQPDVHLVEALTMMGYDHESCVRAAILGNNDRAAACEWLFQNAQRVAEAGQGAAEDQGWRVVSASSVRSTLPRHTPDPLSFLSNRDNLNFRDTGNGIVVMSQFSPVCFAVLFESSWYGRMFVGQNREVMYELQDLDRRPLVRISKPFAWLSQEATVAMITDSSSELGTIKNEFDMTRRKIIVSDSTPGHSMGEVRIEGHFTQGFFTIFRGDSEIGRIVRPKNGMGLANLDLLSGALDAFRANRMRALLISATLLISDVYWGAAPIGFLKAPLPILR